MDEQADSFKKTLSNDKNQKECSINNNDYIHKSVYEFYIAQILLN